MKRASTPSSTSSELAASAVTGSAPSSTTETVMGTLRTRIRMLPGDGDGHCGSQQYVDVDVSGQVATNVAGAYRLLQVAANGSDLHADGAG